MTDVRPALIHVAKRSKGGMARWVPNTVVLMVTWLLIGPRVPLANVAGSSVRLEDAFIAILWVYVLCRWRSVSEHLPRRRVMAIAAIGVLASLFAVLAGRVSIGPALLYSIRPLEYWVVFPALFFVLENGSEKAGKFFIRVLGLVTVVQVGVAALQALLGLDLGFSKFSTERGAGLTAGPYELGAMCSMLSIFWLFRKNYVLALVAACGVFLAASRISILGLLIGGLVALMLTKRAPIRKALSRERRFARTVYGLLVVCASATFVLSSPMSSEQLGTPVVDRLQDTSTMDAWQSSGAFASGIQLPETSDEYNQLAYGYMPYLLGDGGFATAVSGEASDMVRFFRWHVLVNLLNDPATWLFGLGPSFAGASVDGSYLRMVAETGIAGLLVWLGAIRGWSRSLDPSLFGAVIALLVGALFIDVLYSLRTMVLLWAMLAFHDEERRRPSDLKDQTRAVTVGNVIRKGKVQ
jgi:hypothetical protein